MGGSSLQRKLCSNTQNFDLNNNLYSKASKATKRVEINQNVGPFFHVLMQSSTHFNMKLHNEKADSLQNIFLFFLMLLKKKNASSDFAGF